MVNDDQSKHRTYQRPNIRSRSGDFAKVSLSFEEKFGISQDETEGHTDETSDTVEDVLEVESHKETAITFTTNNSAVDCMVSIDAAGDWKLRIIPPVGIPVNNATFCDSLQHGNGWTNDRNDPNPTHLYRGHNGVIIVRSDATGHDCNINLTEADDLVRLVKGFAVDCPSCINLQFSTKALAAIEIFSSTDARHISFEGTRHTNNKADASYAAYDITGESESCVAAILGREGVDVSTLDVDGDGILDACKGDQ